MAIRKVFIGKHLARCSALEQVKRGWWRTPWSCLDGVRFRDGCGRGRGHEAWVEVQCNDPDCKAVMLLNSDDILEAAGESKPAPRRGRRT